MIPFSQLDLDIQKDFAAAFTRRFSTAQQRRELFLHAGISVSHDGLDDLKLWQDVFSHAEKRNKTEALIEAAIDLRPDDEILLAISDVLQPLPKFNLLSFDRFSYKNNQPRYKRYGALSGLVFSLGIVGFLFSSSEGDAAKDTNTQNWSSLSQQSKDNSLVSTENRTLRNKVLEASQNPHIRATGRISNSSFASNSKESLQSSQKSNNQNLENTVQETPNQIEASSEPNLLISSQAEPSSFHDPLAAALAQATDRLLEQEHPSNSKATPEKSIRQKTTANKTEKTTRMLAQKRTSLNNKEPAKVNATPQKASSNEQKSTAQTVYKKCNYKTGEELYGYWWGGKNLHLKKGNTIIIGEWSHVREEFPAAKNRFNIKTNSNCVLRPGEKVELKDEPVMINGHAWIAIYGASIQE
ncbi:MAG: hypothetical protein CMK59_02155 [Proteobacteria bacterium]|nr:hypothetical protein [Pseudomonadota bacterium]